jgi:hypothetical protein
MRCENDVVLPVCVLEGRGCVYPFSIASFPAVWNGDEVECNLRSVDKDKHLGLLETLNERNQSSWEIHSPLLPESRFKEKVK